MEWLDKLKDMLKSHIFTGLQGTYLTVNRMTHGVNTLKGFQMALSGIEDVQQKKLTEDYDALMITLKKNNYDESVLEQAIKNAHYSYARSALQGAGLNCDGMDLSIINVPTGREFVHMVYINAAREIWMQPHLFCHKYPAVTQLENQRKTLIIIEGAIESTVRNGINLNKIITAYQTGTLPTVSVRKVREPTLKQKFQRLNSGKTILDDATDHPDDPEEDLVEQAVHSISGMGRHTHSSDGNGIGIPRTRVEPPPTPSTVGIVTVDNDAMTDDGQTIQTIQSSPEEPESIRICVNMEDAEDVKKSEGDTDTDADTIVTIVPEKKPHRKGNSDDVIRKIPPTGGVPEPEEGEEIMKIQLDPGTKYTPKTEDSSMIKIVRNDENASGTVSVHSVTTYGPKMETGDKVGGEIVEIIEMDSSDSDSDSDSGDSVYTASTVPQKPKKPVNTIAPGLDIEDMLGGMSVTNSLPGASTTVGIPCEIIEDTGTDAIMIKNSNKAQDTEVVNMVEELEDQPIMSISVDSGMPSTNDRDRDGDGEGDGDGTNGSVKVKLLDEEEELSSRLSRLRARKYAVRNVGMVEN